MNNPFRKPTFTDQPSLNIWPEVSHERVISKRLRYQPPRLFKRLLDRWFGGSIWTALLLLALGLCFLTWCWFLYTGDVQPDLNSCSEGSQRVHGWSNGRYTNLCIDPVHR